jgi:AcrR family transcriptional regulator
MPTGIALTDGRQLLFDAAEQVLLREGPSGLTSRAVTTEAGCSKGVLYRYFPDFDTFLAELVEDRIAEVDEIALRLQDTVGEGAVVANLTAAVRELFGSVTVAIVALLISHDGLRSRIRQTRPAGVPLLSEATAAVASYLAAEQARGRVAGPADIEVLAPTLIGAVHLLYADRTGLPPDQQALGKVVAAVVG